MVPTCHNAADFRVIILGKNPNPHDPYIQLYDNWTKKLFTLEFSTVISFKLHAACSLWLFDVDCVPPRGSFFWLPHRDCSFWLFEVNCEPHCSFWWLEVDCGPHKIWLFEEDCGTHRYCSSWLLKDHLPNWGCSFGLLEVNCEPQCSFWL